MKSLCLHLFSSLELGKPHRTYVLPIMCSPRDAYNVLKFSISFCYSVKQSFMQVCHSFKYAITLVQQHCKWNNIYLSLTRHYTTVASVTAFFQTGSGAAAQFVYSQWYKFVLAPEVPSYSQCRNHLIVAHKMKPGPVQV